MTHTDRSHMRAIGGGEKCIVENPLSLSKELTELGTMAERQASSGLLHHQNRRWDEDLLTVREILKDQTMGEIFRIESRVHGSRGYGDWRKEKAHARRMVAGLGVHLFDQILSV